MSSELAKRLDKAEKLIQRGKPDLALQEYLDILREDSGNDKVREVAADLYVALNRNSEAAELLAPLFERQASIGDHAHAVITYKKLARLGAPTVEQAFRFGQLVEKSNRKEAVEAYQHAVTGYIAARRQAEARAALQRIIALEPRIEHYQRDGELALELGDRQGAAAAFFEAGELEHKAGNDGLVWFERAHAADPRNLMAGLAYGRVVLGRGDAAKAISILQPFAAEATGLDFREVYGRALLAAGRPVEAEPFIWELYQRDPNQVREAETLLAALLDAGQPSRALDLAKRLEAQEHKLGRRREFAKNMKEVVNQHPVDLAFLEYMVDVFNSASREHDYCETLLKLFDLYFAAGNFMKAGDALDRAAEVDPYESGHQARLEMLRGKIDAHFFNAIADRFTAVGVREEEDQPLPNEAERQTTILEDFILQAEIFLQYSMRSKALERLERVSKLFPYEEEKNEKLHQLYLAAGFTPNYQDVPRPAGMLPPPEAAAAPAAALAAANEDAVDNISRVTEITRNIYRQGNVKSVLFTTVNEVGRHWGASRCVAGLCKPGKPPSAALEYCAPNIKQSDVMAIVRLIAGLQPLIQQQATVSIPYARTAPELAPIQEVLSALEVQSVLAAPLLDGDQPVGILILEQCGSPRQWRHTDAVVLKTIADQVVQAFHNARLRSLMKTLAVTEEKSGLLKRSSYLDVLLSELRRAQHQNSLSSVLLFNFGRAGALVKECGEAAVNEMMMQIGQILSAHVRQTDMAVRYDLTTVALILSDTNAKNSFFVVDKMRKVLAGVKVPGNDRPLPITVGIAEAVVHPRFDPVDMVTEVINRAEAALEIAKSEGGNKAHSLAPSLEATAVV